MYGSEIKSSQAYWNAYLLLLHVKPPFVQTLRMNEYTLSKDYTKNVPKKLDTGTEHLS